MPRREWHVQMTGGDIEVHRTTLKDRKRFNSQPFFLLVSGENDIGSIEADVPQLEKLRDQIDAALSQEKARHIQGVAE